MTRKSVLLCTAVAFAAALATIPQRALSQFFYDPAEEKRLQRPPANAPGIRTGPAAAGQPTRPGATPPAAGRAPAPSAAIQTLPGAQPRSGAPGARPGGATPLDQLRRERREVKDGNRTLIQEGNRTIIKEAGQQFIRHNLVDRFRNNAREVNVERQGNATVTVAVRPNGVRVVTEVDDTGRLLRTTRRMATGREAPMIENSSFEAHGNAIAALVVKLAPPAVKIPPELYVRDAAKATADDIFFTLVAPPVEPLERRYALDEILYSESVRARMPRVDIDTVNFANGSWEIAPDQAEHLAPISQALMNAIKRNPVEVFLVEGYTDAVGNDTDNLSLSDRRAESVALVLTNQFGVPAENLVTQGYGEQFPKVVKKGAERANRRFAIRRITSLLNGEQR
jgi:OmpA-OmpF porin, OOP family